MIWKHIHFCFELPDWDNKGCKILAQDSNYHKYPKGKYVELIKYIQSIVESFGEELKRFFFLFEDHPHLFLALEFSKNCDFKKINNIIQSIERPSWIFISKLMPEYGSSGDEGNGNHALDLWYATAKFIFWRCSENYRPEYVACDENKVIHCFCNPNFVTFENESRFYITGLLQRGVSFQLVFKLIFNMLRRRFIKTLKKLSNR